MIDKPFFPFTLNRKHLTRPRRYLHFGAEQDLQNWWNFWHKSDPGWMSRRSCPKCTLTYQDCHKLHGRIKLKQSSKAYGTDGCDTNGM